MIEGSPDIFETVKYQIGRNNRHIQTGFVPTREYWQRVLSVFCEQIRSGRAPNDAANDTVDYFTKIRTMHALSSGESHFTLTYPSNMHVGANSMTCTSDFFGEVIITPIISNEFMALGVILGDLDKYLYFLDAAIQAARTASDITDTTGFNEEWNDLRRQARNLFGHTIGMGCETKADINDKLGEYNTLSRHTYWQIEQVNGILFVLLDREKNYNVA